MPTLHCLSLPNQESYVGMRKSGNLSKFWMVSFSRRMVWDTNLFKLNQYLSNWIISLNLKPTPRLLWQGNIFDGNYRYSTWLYIAPPQVLLLNSRSSWFLPTFAECVHNLVFPGYIDKKQIYTPVNERINGKLPFPIGNTVIHLHSWWFSITMFVYRV